MAAISHNKEDLSVDSVHTPFGLTKQRRGRLRHVSNEPKPRTLIQDLEVMLRSPPLPMKTYRTTGTYRTREERTE